MRCLVGLLGFCWLVAVSNASVVPRRIYRNTEEILVPVTIIQDGEEVKEAVNLQENKKEAEITGLQPKLIAEDIAAAAVEAEQKLEELEAAVQSQRRIDEAIVEEEIDEAIQAVENNEREQEIDNAKKATLAELTEIVAPLQAEEQLRQAAAIIAQDSEPAAVIVAEGEIANNANGVAQQPIDLERQATQATPTQTTTQQNFVQQLIQNSPLGQFFNQITGQAQVSNDETVAAPAPGLFNPVTAVQNAAQSVVNSTTQAFQGLQQFASNLGNQFQNTLSGLGGQPPAQASNDPTTARPPGPIQQLVNSFIPPQAQPAPAQPGPFQGLLNIFQGNNRPQQAANATAVAPPAKQPETQEDTQAAAAAEANDQATNEVRDSGEANDSFEESAQPGELIVVNDETTQTENKTEQDNVTN